MTNSNVLLIIKNGVNMKNKIIQKYILRYYLPVEPNYDKNYTETRFCELLSFCKKNCVEAVMFYVALDANCYYMPDSVEYSRACSEQMLPYIERLRENGIGYQINFQNLIGATANGEDFKRKFEWEFMVDQNGVEVPVACPIGEKFREQSEKRLKIWAETNPDVIWIDDDLRYHGHGAFLTANTPPYTDFYCFCENHIKQFNAEHGTNYDRESLVGKILAEGEPSWERIAYLDFLNQTIVDTAKWIEKTIHGINKHIRIAQMTSSPKSHAAEGRRWQDFLSALSGNGNMPVVRPTFGPYKENVPADFIFSYALFSQLKANIAEVFPKEVAYCPEIENTRFTVWSKSVAATSFQLALSAFLGCESVTLSLYDLDGGALFDEPSYGNLLKRQKARQNKVLALGLAEACDKGVQIPESGFCARNYLCGENAKYSDLRGEEEYIYSYFLKMGVPCKFVSPKAIDRGRMVVIDAFAANFIGKNDLIEILKGKIFIDAGAAQLLESKGLGEFIGLKNLQSVYPVVQSEELKDCRRKDGTFIRVPSRVFAGCSYTAELSEGVKVLSEFILPNGRKNPALIEYQNCFGGTVLCYLAKDNWGDGFFTHRRVEFFKTVLRKADADLPQINCSSYTLFCVKEKAGIKYYMITNLSTDIVTEYVIDNVKVKVSLATYESAVFSKKENAEKMKLICKI